MNFYRYSDSRFKYGEYTIVLEQFILIKETPQGYWITDEWDHTHEFKRWVSKHGRKRYAYPSKKEALESFLARKKRQIEILKAQLHGAEVALEIGKEINPQSDDSTIFHKKKISPIFHLELPKNELRKQETVF